MNYRSCVSLSFSFDTGENSLRTACPFALKLLYNFLLSLLSMKVDIRGKREILNDKVNQHFSFFLSISRSVVLLA